MGTRRSRFPFHRLMSLAICAALLAGCEGDDGSAGAQGPPGQPGTPGTPGAPAGATIGKIISAGDVSFDIAPVQNTLAGGQPFALRFTATAKNAAGDVVPLTGLNMIALYSLTAVPNTSGNGAPIEWVNNAQVQGKGTSMYCTLTGTYTSRGQTGNACTLVEDPAAPGTYTGTWTHAGAAPIMNPQDDLTRPHRIFLRAYNLEDPNGVAIEDKVMSHSLDYVPATGVLVDDTGKDTVSDAACIACHGETDGRIAKIEAHHNYQSTEKCVACHNADLVPTPAQRAEGWVFDLGPMVHRLHAGHHLTGLSGEAAEYFGEIGFPSPITECTVCHDNGDSWTANINREACGGCHKDVDFATGVGHELNGGALPQTSDANCRSCHAAGSISPAIAHKVGKRADYASLMNVDFTSITATPSPTPGKKTVTIRANITLNGSPIPNGTDLRTVGNSVSNPERMLSANGLLIGTVASDGTVYAWRDALGGLPAVSNTNLASGTLADGIWTWVADVDDARATGTIYVASEAKFCVASAQAGACNRANMEFGPSDPNHPLRAGVGNTSPMKFFNVDGGVPVKARMAVANRITVEESKCNACHSSLDYAKGFRHGTYTFDQCSHCHNDTGGATGHATVKYRNDAGSFVVNPDVTFGNKDLVTVTHRYHSGNFDSEGGVFRDYANILYGYPNEATECAACHKDGIDLFASNGGLTSGKRSIKSGANYLSPVAESCRSCHAHADGAALAHFKSNGAIVQGDTNTVQSLPIESCATCHAEGKSYGVDKVHAGGGAH